MFLSLTGLIGLTGLILVTAGGLTDSSAQAAVAPDRLLLLATAYTTQTLPTLQRGDRGEAVRKLQAILQSNGFLGAANVRLGNPGYNQVDGIFGAVTESAVKDLQSRYQLSPTGVVDPTTWEVLDVHENPYRSLLPWKL
ncbi:MAG: peptidoglycan-binding protein [Pegethrix bostrychoides GSE-TBD4-15B]|jgi:peptidoglycan hydrolase-like protein with peptidoglycan-binding domain|uniref:Peptidoglycan-binding protein n=1 Tax=Pegethrix bostrychoides GSE-TBD4-15B TaxID=2839662 RepID=A0A951PC81_9CYAN|nr:peptidoglycan-binding protein [Pegethrix bostrychoides GSE-TBD4-15B]